MPAKGKHRRPKSRSFSRGLAVAGTGGAVLAMPVIGATTASAAPAAVHSAVAKPVAAVKAAPTSYAVVDGDSLAKIADALNVSGGWKQLYQDNQSVIGGNPALIRPGMKLTLGAPAASTARDASADRSARTTDLTATATVASTTTYANNLDGWIKQSLAIMAQHGIPGSYDGIYRNVMRESSGNPMAINNWDSNAVAGTPSKGLLQVIQPTFSAFHVPGTSTDLYDPIANITAACNYAAKTYGSIDNVFGAY